VAGEQDQTAQTQQTSQSSQDQAHQSETQDKGASKDGSNSSTGTDGKSQTAARPDYIPESHWDATKNAPKETFGQHVKDLTAFQAAEQSRKLAIPQKPEDYKLALPKTWQPPEGVEYKLDEKDPRWERARAWAHKYGIPQEAFEEGIEMLASTEVASATEISKARNNQINALGVNGTARVSAALTWLDAKGYGAMKGMVVTKDIVEAVELMMRRDLGGHFSQSHRVAAVENGKIDGYEKMTFEQRRATQDAMAAQKTN
jgi:hypothetical protein